MRLIFMIENMNLFKTFHKQKFKCEFCKRDKMRKRSFKRFQTSIQKKNECFDTNLKKSINSFIINDHRYYVLNTCREINKFFLYFMKQKTIFFAYL